MVDTLKKLSLGIVLLLISAGVLLYTDRGSRHAKVEAMASKPVVKVAMVQHASIEVLEQGAEGVLSALAARGYRDGGRLRIQRFNPEGDIGTANAIAKEVSNGSFDMLITLSTVSLQTVANANQTGARTPHVFGLVSDPYSAGVGISATNHLMHPPYLVGSGCIQPIKRILETALQMRPQLKKIGLVWNAAEANSVAQTKLVREVCGELGLQVIDTTVDNSSGVLEAANAVIGRGAECILMTGDVTVIVASHQVIAACERARIPAFSSTPGQVQLGSLFDLGADYVQIGEHTGDIAADILDGKDPAEVPIDDFVPSIFLYNETVLAGLKDRWEIPDGLRDEADGFITATTTNLSVMTASRKREIKPTPRAGRTYKIAVAYFAPDEAADLCRKGLVDGLRELGFVEGRNLEIRSTHAQGEIANIPGMIQNLEASDVDLIVPISTPVISAASSIIRQKPTVFTGCSDPIAAGVGQSFTNHLPFITGIGSFPPVQAMVDAIRSVVPGVRSVGTIYNASEVNSVKVVGVARDLFMKAGIKLEEVSVANSAEILEAGRALASRKVDALYIQSDNTVRQGFDAVLKVATDGRLPLFVDEPEVAERGALACIGLGFYQPGFAAAMPAARVLCGESPAEIPIENVSEETVWLNMSKAQQLGLTFPKDLIAQQTPSR
jgi:ABC-type uncharacterized transport system substrate-binding protein